MPINVVCPGCLKRFKVSERFAGMKGPCPSCNTIIDIPKEQVTIHAPDDAVRGGKAVHGGAVNAKPISRMTRDFDATHFYYAAGGAVGVLLLVALFGRLGLGTVIRDGIGVVGLLLLAMPISIYGYLTLRDRETLFVWTGRDLYQRCGACAGVYVLAWILMELSLRYTGGNSDIVYLLVIVSLFCGLACLAPHVFLDFDLSQALGHYAGFFVVMLLLRGLLGLGWLWQITPRQSLLPI